MNKIENLTKWEEELTPYQVLKLYIIEDFCYEFLKLLRGIEADVNIFGWRKKFSSNGLYETMINKFEKAKKLYIKGGGIKVE